MIYDVATNGKSLVKKAGIFGDHLSYYNKTRKSTWVIFIWFNYIELNTGSHKPLKMKIFKWKYNYE